MTSSYVLKVLRNPTLVILGSLLFAAMFAWAWFSKGTSFWIIQKWFAIYGISMGGDFPLMTPDSDSYINHSSVRTPGYPLFLSCVNYLFGSLEAAAWLQLFLAAVTHGVLGCEIGRLSRKSILGWFSLLILWCRPDYNEYHFYIMTESLFSSVLCLYVVCLLRFILTRNQKWIVVVGILSGLAYAIRPTGMVLLVTTPIILLLHWRAWGVSVARPIIISVLMMLMVSGGSELVHRLKHGSDSPSLKGLTVFSRGVMSADNISTDINPEIRAHLIEVQKAIKPLVDIARSNSITLQTELLARYTTYIQYKLWYDDPYLKDLLIRQGDSEKMRFDEVQYSIGFRLIYENIDEFLRQSWLNYVQLWLSPSSVFESMSYASFIERYGPLPFIEWPQPNFSKSVTTPFRHFIRDWLGRACLFISMACVVLSVCWRNKTVNNDWRLTVGIVATATAHSVFAFTALTNLAIERYSLALWPVLSLFLIIAISLLPLSSQGHFTRTS